MNLIDLNPHWIGYGGEGASNADGSSIPRREKTAIGLDCPCGCEHPLCVILANPVDGLGPVQGGPAWQRTGDTFENLSLSPSIQRNLPCANWHGYITDGKVIAL